MTGHLAWSLVSVWVCLCSPAEMKADVELKGAGASFPQGVYIEWMSAFELYRSKHAQVHMTYEAVGSTRGRKRIIEENTDLAFGASDSPFSEEEKLAAPDLQMFPSMAGAVVVCYNIPGLGKRLVLSLEVLVGIYNGSITNWNNSHIVELNKHSATIMPNQTIIVIARADSSGTTDIFTTYLSKSSDWNAQYGPFKKRTGWGPNVVSYFGHQTRGMTGLIMSFPYSLGYVSIGDATLSKVSYADMVNSYRKVVGPNTKSVQSVMDQAGFGNSPSLDSVLMEYESPEGYPIAGFTYFIVRMSTMKDCVQAKELVRFIYWMLSTAEADRTCAKQQMTPLSSSLKEAILNKVLYQITCDKLNMWEEAQEDLKRENAEVNTWVVPVSVVCVILGGALLSVLIYLGIRFYRFNKLLSKNEWEILIEDIVFFHTAQSSTTGQCRFTLWPSVSSLTDIDDVEEGYQMLEHILQWPGKVNSTTIGLRLLEVKSLKTITRANKVFLLGLKHSFNHQNVLKFYGLTSIQEDWYFVGEYCAKGSLTDALKDRKFNFNKDFQFSLAYDIVSGLAYLHSKSVYHGCLKCSCCLIDFRWTVKIADWEFCSTSLHADSTKNPLLALRKSADIYGFNEASFDNFWTAPEIIKSDYVIFPSASTDIFSYSIMVQEIFTREDPYTEHSQTMSPQELIKAVVNNKLRPYHKAETPGTIRHIQECAWSEEPSQRPSAEQLMKMIRDVHTFKRSVVDSMMEAAEEYNLSLEEQLAETRNSLEETKATLDKYTDRLFLFGSKSQLEGCNMVSNSVQTLNACLVCIKCTRNSSDDNNAWSMLNNMDMMLEQFASAYNAHRVDIATGAFLLVFASMSKTTSHVTNAAKFSLQLTAYTTELFAGLNQPATSGFRVAVHKGTVKACYLNNVVLKTFLVGENVEIVYSLVEKSANNRILVTKSYYDALNTWAKGSFILERNVDKLNGNLQNASTYWLVSEVSHNAKHGLENDPDHLPVIV